MSDELPPDAWQACIWAAPLKPLEKLVACVFADRCRGPVVWVSYPDLMKCTGLSRDAAVRALRGLVDAGWLTVTQPGRQHQATRYRLSQPSGSRTAERADDESSSPSQPSVSRTRRSTSYFSTRQQSVRRTPAARAPKCSTCRDRGFVDNDGEDGVARPFVTCPQPGCAAAAAKSARSA